MARFRRKRKRMTEINVVPYIDVMLVLLIIFMVTTPLLSQGVKVNLPNAQAKALSADKQLPIIVTISQAGQYYLNIAKDSSKPITTEVLQQSVQGALQQNPDRKVFVRADQGVEYGKVVDAMVILQSAGSPNVGLMTDGSKSAND